VVQRGEVESVESMTSRERVIAAMRRRRPDRVPFDFSFGFSPSQLAEFRRRTGQDDPDDYFGADTRMVDPDPTRLATDFSAYLGELPLGAYVDEWGVGRQPTTSTDPAHSHLEGFIYPMVRLATSRDAAAYPLPDIEADYRYDEAGRQIADIQSRGLAPMAMKTCTIFEVAWNMRSMELLLMDFVDRSDFATTLLDRITAKREVQAHRYAELGADVISVGDDVGTQRGMLMSPSMWRVWLKPRLARVIAAARSIRADALIFYHSDGDVTPIIPDLIEIGVDILNPVQPECMDPAGLKRRYGEALSFWGTIGTQTTFPFGTAGDVRRAVKLRVETVGGGGGLFLAPTHTIEPEVPFENIVAFVEAVKECGWYDRTARRRSS
jgi:uroporphyrinogen decarboxylase